MFWLSLDTMVALPLTSLWLSPYMAIALFKVCCRPCKKQETNEIKLLTTLVIGYSLFTGQHKTYQCDLVKSNTYVTFYNNVNKRNTKAAALIILPSLSLSEPTCVPCLAICTVALNLGSSLSLCHNL